MGTTLRDQIIRLASGDQALRPLLAGVLKRAGRWTHRSVVQELDDKYDEWLSVRTTRPDSKDSKRMQDIIYKAGGDTEAALRLAVRQAKSIKDISKAIRRGAASQNRKEPVMSIISQVFYGRAIELAGGPPMRVPVAPKSQTPKTKRTPPPVPSGLLPAGVDGWQLYDMAGASRAARSLTSVLTTALKSLGTNVGRGQTSTTRGKAIKAIVMRVSKALDRHSEFGSADTEPRYTARSTMRTYIELILGVRKGFLFGDYPEVEAALDWV